MSNPSKKKGTIAESKVVKFLKEKGIDAKRKALSGSRDEGDIEISFANGASRMLEIKAGKQTENYNRAQLEEWLAQTRVESINSDQIGYLVIVRYRRKLSDAEVWDPNTMQMRWLDDFSDVVAYGTNVMRDMYPRKEE